MPAFSATEAQRTSAADLVAQVSESATDDWVAEEVGRIARMNADDPAPYRLALLDEWVRVLAARATAKTGLVTAAADDHTSKFLRAPNGWKAEQVALSATIVALDPTPYNVSLLRGFTRSLIITLESDLI